MPALVAGIHVLIFLNNKDVDGRDEPGHDERMGRTLVPLVSDLHVGVHRRDVRGPGRLEQRWPRARRPRHGVRSLLADLGTWAGVQATMSPTGEYLSICGSGATRDQQRLRFSIKPDDTDRAFARLDNRQRPLSVTATEEDVRTRSSEGAKAELGHLRLRGRRRYHSAAEQVILMNRKTRRAARHQRHEAGTGQAGPVARSETQPLFAAALQHQRTGRPAEAAQLYDRILKSEPTHADSLQNLGVIALNAGRADMAVDLFRRCLAVRGPSPELHCNLAAALYTMKQIGDAIVQCRRALAINPDHVGTHIVLGEIFRSQAKREEAIGCYRRVLDGAPDHAQTHANLALALTELGRFDEARPCFERALELEPDNGPTHLSYGNSLLDQGEMAHAIDCYLRAMEIKPDDLIAHYNFGAALFGLSKFDAVVEYYEQFLAIKPDFAHGYNVLASAYNAVGNTTKALEAVRRGLAVAETDRGKAIFVQCLCSLTAAPGGDLRDLIIRAVSEPWCRPMTLARYCVALIQANPELVACAARAFSAWPALLHGDQLFGPSGLQALSRDELLRVYLENSRVVDVGMERFLTAVRFALLAAAVPDTELDEHTLALYCALSRQCFITEYAFLQTEQETAQVNALRETVDAALRANAPVSPIRLAAIAAYMSLRSLTGHETLLARSWPAPVEALLTQQIREPAEEARLRNAIPAITPIEDSVSIAVRSQYEDNPYPRWVEAPEAEFSMPINRRIRAAFPLAEFRYLKTTGAIDILVAGCGTGQTLIDYVNGFAEARVLAVDLSLTSLAYARRKIQALGVHNIELAQADLLKLGSLDRTFDLINCGGVLHHLADPMAGWQVLLSLLKPDGFMSVALYSDIARADYVAAQRLIAERGYGRSPDEIRRFRREFIAGEHSKMRNGVLTCPDFFSISECRDLLFHVQEHRMTIPQLKAFFEQKDLRFLGFEIERPVLMSYSKRFPDDPARTNLDNWHVFEQENPQTFISMYQFWVQKGRAAA